MILIQALRSLWSTESEDNNKKCHIKWPVKMKKLKLSYFIQMMVKKILNKMKINFLPESTSVM